MKKLPMFLATLTLGALLSSQHTDAITLDLAPSSSDVSIGDSLNVDVIIAGLGSGSAPSVGAFDLDVAFDTDIFLPTIVTFGPFLGDPLRFEALTDFNFTTPGIVDFAEVSLLSPSELDALQPSAFSLATVSFTAIAGGSGQFSFAGDRRVDDPFGNKLSFSIPEPATGFLLAIGFIALQMLRRAH